jgi:hypothetical protein
MEVFAGIGDSFHVGSMLGWARVSELVPDPLEGTCCSNVDGNVFSILCAIARLTSFVAWTRQWYRVALAGIQTRVAKHYVLLLQTAALDSEQDSTCLYNLLHTSYIH